MRCQIVLCALLIAMLSIIPACAAQGGSPSAEEAAALAALKGQISGRIVWESNRTGAWELYVMNADGTGARRLTSMGTPGDPLASNVYRRPQFSPDGSEILFANGKARAPIECWLADPDSGDVRRLCVGCPLNWLPDGSGFFFLRDKQIWRYDLAAGQESLALPLTIASADPDTVGHVAPDLSVGVFRFAKNEYIRLSDGAVLKTTAGCEPGMAADGRTMYWVNGPKDFRVWDPQTDTEQEMLGTPPVEPFNYTYFPTVTRDNKWLMYGASPSQHDHTTSDYEVYLHRLDNWKPAGEPVRLTFNSGTDRWPFLWLGRTQALSGTYDVAANRATNPPPPPLSVFSFAKDGAAPDWGGDTGLWPQAEGCGGEAVWQAEDAEGGSGGSMRITYGIAAEPHSFSMWFAPGRNVDLSAFDRFVIYARGDQPTFTLVVKDASSDPEGATEAGIADITVRGVSNQWKRFEVPFADFTPRVAGSRINWGAINHAGVAIIGGRNSNAGTLEVDNLRAVAGE
jgi:hypothetical protein